MSTVEVPVRKPNKKRKHRDTEEAQPSPAKKSKGGLRSERRRAELDADTSKSKGPKASLGEAGDKPTSKRVLKKLERKEQRKAAAAAPVLEEGQSEGELETAVLDHGKEGEGFEDVYDGPEEARRQIRKQRKKAKKLGAQLGKPKQQNASKAVKKQKEKQKEKQQQKQRSLAHNVEPAARWNLSEPAAGRFLNHDPLFVRDAHGKEFLIAAVGKELQVLSFETSLLDRTLPARQGATILGFAVESPASNLVHVAYSRGGIHAWDWTIDDNATTSETPLIGDMKDFAVSRLRGETSELFLAYITRVDGLYVIQMKGGATYKSSSALESIQVLDNAQFILARGPEILVVGSRKDDKGYAWAELPLARPSTCMDARIVEVPVGSKKASKRLPQLQLAIGNEDGQIHLYDDAATLISQGQQALPAPRILHWHRSAVSSVKLSPDGSYLISGGKETVLVLWQLETGRKQYLPHLTSDIERITVNALGDRYALQMGDNSIMVLSTAELKPVANFAGLQMQRIGIESSKVPAAVLHPEDSRKLLLTVPLTQPASANEAAPRPFLQTFDVRTARHMNRQALTRNNATDLNVSPEDNAILPPDVVHLALSQDGERLATVDEWMPPVSDVLHLASDRSGNEEARLSRREVYLKIWHWDAPQGIWTLSTRADSPHQRAGKRSMGAGRVLALVSDPVSNGFATVGEDDCVKIWKPRRRMRGGVPMKDAQDVELIEWSCKRSVQLSSTRGRADSPMELSSSAVPSSAAAAYSSDGSLLAVSSNIPTTLDESVPAVTFIDTATGSIKAINTGLSDGRAITALGFLERYFIAVTHTAGFVWDLVSDTLIQKIKLPRVLGVAPQLVVGEADQMFALITPADKEGQKSRVLVYSMRDMGKMYKRDFETAVVKVLAGKASRGFTLLFADATIRTIMPTGAASSAGFSALAVQSTAPPSQAMDVVEPEPASLLTSSSAVETEGLPAFEIDEDDRPVVRPEQLASILDVGQSFAMPPVKDMFQGVVRLFGRKSERAVAVM